LLIAIIFFGSTFQGKLSSHHKVFETMRLQGHQSNFFTVKLNPEKLGKRNGEVLVDVDVVATSF
jgi:hypothetical protein